MNIKSIMVITFLVVSTISIPMMAYGQQQREEDFDEDEGQAGAFQDFRGGFGGVFSENMGYGGDLIGSLFEMLLLDGLDLEDHETLESVYVLSASKEEEYSGNYDFEKEEDTVDIHYLPQRDEENNTNWQRIPDGKNDYNVTDTINEYAYCKVEKEGGFHYNLTIGAALTLIIWDYDKSFIEAAQKVLDWAGKFREAEDDDEVTQELITEGIQVLSWILIHINDIFTGDELFVFNPIVWQKLRIDPWNASEGDPEDFGLTKTWYDFGPDGKAFNADDVDLTATNPGLLWYWNQTAKRLKDSTMEWLLTETSEKDVAETIWTQFSFDLAQLWMKKFYIEIDFSELDEDGFEDMEKAFGGCEIEFYLFTHHLAGAFLYDDADLSEDITVEYEVVKNETTGDPIMINGTVVEVPTSDEITHQLILGTVDNFDFSEPKIDDDGDSISWGLTLEEPTISAVPVGVDLNSYLGAPKEELDDIYFGLEFITEIEEPNDEGEIEASGEVKLDTNWAPWNDGNGPNNQKVVDDELDMAIIYASSMLHFELEMDKDDDPDDPETKGVEKDQHTLKIGNYLDDDDDNLDFVDIAGPGYYIGNSTTDRVLDQATTSTIDVALWEGTHEEKKYAKDEDGEYEEENADEEFSGDVNARAEWSLYLYAVCYPEFNGTGRGIWHDPTFSVYMVFTPESAGFWALILLIAGIGLAGVATILIKRRKDKMY
ncbi:MAG: hypothetical protein GF383_14155 [Candidatus Lokiarchaeota archaeon]|nr:hypothetical protein [Candidatus Lokiarchaeota archaeon]